MCGPMILFFQFLKTRILLKRRCFQADAVPQSLSAVWKTHHHLLVLDPPFLIQIYPNLLRSSRCYSVFQIRTIWLHNYTAQWRMPSHLKCASFCQIRARSKFHLVTTLTWFAQWIIVHFNSANESIFRSRSIFNYFCTKSQSINWQN